MLRFDRKQQNSAKQFSFSSVQFSSVVGLGGAAKGRGRRGDGEGVEWVWQGQGFWFFLLDPERSVSIDAV